MESQLTINTNNMKRTNLLLLSLCALGLIFTRCDFNWNFSRKYTIAIKQPDQAYIQSAELDSIWKSSYEYAVLIPEDTTISTYFHLIEALNSNQPYNCTNTLIICHTKDTAPKANNELRLFFLLFSVSCKRFIILTSAFSV